MDLGFTSLAQPFTHSVSCTFLVAQSLCLALVADLWVVSPHGPYTLKGFGQQPPPFSFDGTDQLLGSGVRPLGTIPGSAIHFSG